MTSLWADYINERLGQSVLTEDYGFLVYKFNGEVGEFLDLYIRPEFRRQGKGTEITKKALALARESGVKHIFTSVCIGTNGPEVSLAGHLKLGFRLDSCHNNRIILVRETGE